MNARADGTPAGDVDFWPVLTAAEVTEGEAADTGQGAAAVARRVTMAILTRSAAELRQGWAQGPEGMLTALEAAGYCKARAQALSEMAEAAQARLLLTGREVVGDGSEGGEGGP